MKKIKSAVRELKDTLAYFGLFTSLFDTLVLFAVLILVFYLTNIPWYFAFLFAIPYLFFHTKTTLRKLSIRFVEKKVPELKEELRTAADTKNVEKNEIVDLLREDTLKKMKKIKSSYFIKLGKLTRQIIFLAVISFLIVAVSAYHVRFIDVPKSLFELKDLGKENYMIDEELLSYDELDDADIFGEKNIAELGDKELLLELNPEMSGVDISQVSDPFDSYFDEVIPPSDIEAMTDASYDESYSNKYRRIIRYYFNEISKKR